VWVSEDVDEIDVGADEDAGALSVPDEHALRVPRQMIAAAAAA
jgi:hypothetical protein